MQAHAKRAGNGEHQPDRLKRGGGAAKLNVGGESRRGRQRSRTEIGNRVQDGGGYAPYQRPIDADRIHGDAGREPHPKIDDEHDREIVLIHLMHVVENPQCDLSPFERRSHDLHQLVPK